MCLHWEVDGIANTGIVGSGLACFPLDGVSLLSTLIIANILVRPNAAPLDFSPHIPELSFTQRKAFPITNNEIGGNALFDFFQMIEKRCWNWYTTMACCGLGYIGNFWTIVTKDACPRNLNLRSICIEINAVPLERKRLFAPQTCIKPQSNERF